MNPIYEVSREWINFKQATLRGEDMRVAVYK